MPTAALAQADTGPSYAALRLHLSETTGELDDLRAALDTRLATLEAALANPDECDSLETLVIELARVATTEAEAAAARTCLEAQLAASEQVTAVHADAQRLVQTERAAAHATRAQLEDAQATLQTEREAGARFRRDLDELRNALEGERTAGRALRRSLEEAEQRIFVVESVKELEVSGVREELGNELAAQRAEVAQLERALEEFRFELGAARDAAHKGLTDFEAGQLRIETAERQAAEIERARRDADARAEAALQERAALAAELQAAREAADRRLADVEAAREATEQRLAGAEAAREAAEQRLADAEGAQLRLEAAERQTGDVERKRRDADARAEAALAERAALAGELQAARELAAKRLADVEAAELLLETAEGQRRSTEQERLEADARAEAALRDRAALAADLQAAREAAGAGSAMLARLEALDVERAEMERALMETERSLETAARDRDSVKAALEAALHSARDEATEAEARYAELRDATALRIRDLELDLLEAASNSASAAPANLDVDVEDDEPRREEADSTQADAAPSAADTSYVDRPTRRANRTVLHEEFDVHVDDMPAVLVDISVNGAQVLSPTGLKPNRSVTLLLPVGERSIPCVGNVVWARLEASSDAMTYRGGIYFTSVDAAAIEVFVARIAPSAL